MDIGEIGISMMRKDTGHGAVVEQRDMHRQYREPTKRTGRTKAKRRGAKPEGTRQEEEMYEGETWGRKGWVVESSSSQLIYSSRCERER